VRQQNKIDPNHPLTQQASISIKKNTFVTRGVANEPELSLLKKKEKP
jgi:hypothetical protein